MTERARILIVEDDLGMRSSLRRLLERRYELVEAGGVDQARSQLDQRPVDLAIVDLVLPDGDGFHLLGELVERPEHPGVIVITGDTWDADEKLARALKEKAFYFLTKPFDAIALEALVTRGLEVRRLQRTLRERSEQLEQDLRLAREFQSGLMPARPLEHGDAQVDARFQPCDELAGDYFDYRVQGDAIVFLIADVVGHGVSAAMLTGILSSAWSRAIRDGKSPVEVHQHLLDVVQDWDDQQFFSAFLGRLDASGRLDYVNAGHPAPLLREADGTVRVLKASAPILSPALDEFEASLTSTEMKPGSRLLLFTDGLEESRNPQGDLMGVQPAIELLGGAGRLDEMLDALVERVAVHRAGRPPEDDLTLLMLERGGSA